MASAAGGKKGKKKRGQTLDLNSFLQNDKDASGGKAITIKKTSSSWADQMDFQAQKTVVLPTAPSSVRGGMKVDPDRIPTNGPYKVFVANVSYDANEELIANMFKGLDVVSVHLPLDDTGRFKGFGYVEFGNREDLIEALQMDDLEVAGRKLRIDLKTPSERDQRGYSSFGRSDYSAAEESSDWRSGPRAEPSRERYGGGFGGGAGPRGGDREPMMASKPGSKYDAVPSFSSYARGGSGGGGGGFGGGFDRRGDDRYNGDRYGGGGGYGQRGDSGYRDQWSDRDRYGGDRGGGYDRRGDDRGYDRYNGDRGGYGRRGDDRDYGSRDDRYGDRDGPRSDRDGPRYDRDGPRSDGPDDGPWARDGPRRDPPRYDSRDGPRSDGPDDGPWARDGPRRDPPRYDSRDGPRSDGPDDGPWARDGPRRDPPRYDSRDGPRYDRDGPGPNDGQWGRDGPRRDAPRYDSRDGPRYDSRDGPRYESRDGPRYDSRDRDGPRYDSRDGPRRDPAADSPAGDGDGAPAARPKLNLKPRSAPAGEIGKPVAKSSIFGGAKPVDTAAREREVEERLKGSREPERERERPSGAQRRAEANRDIRLTEGTRNKDDRAPDTTASADGNQENAERRERPPRPPPKLEEHQADFVEPSRFSALAIDDDDAGDQQE